jgi:hypothetical protein
MPSIVIRYDSDEEKSPKVIEVQIHQQRKSETRFITVPIPQTINDHPLESWINPNPQHSARYSAANNNVFMQMQMQPLLGSIPGEEETEDSIDYPLLFLSLPPPDDLPVDDNMAYFLSRRMDSFLGFQDCFSSAYKNLYLLSANNRVLRHVLFAFVKYLNEQDRLSQSVVCNMHLQKVIPALQHSLTSLNFDEGHILAVPLLAYLAFWWRKFDVAKAHLKGFYRMLVHAQYLEQDQYGRLSVSPRMPDVILLMWRVAVRLDHFFGFMRPDDQTIPPIKSNPELSRRYITDFIDPSAVEWTECLVLTDELEDLRNLAVHYNRRSTAVRQSATYTPVEARRYIEQAARKVIRKAEELEGKILNAAATYNAIHNPVFIPAWYVNIEPFPGSQFLHYTPLFKSLHDRFIDAILMNRAALIHTTISSHPKAGPYPLERLQAAIEICCAFATLKERMPFALHGRGRLLEALMFAGYTFCTPDHVLGIIIKQDASNCIEFQWIKKRLGEEAELGHTGALRMNRILDMSWENPEGTCWDMAKITFPN